MLTWIRRGQVVWSVVAAGWLSVGSASVTAEDYAIAYASRPARVTYVPGNYPQAPTGVGWAVPSGSLGYTERASLPGVAYAYRQAPAYAVYQYQQAPNYVAYGSLLQPAISSLHFSMKGGSTFLKSPTTPYWAALNILASASLFMAMMFFAPEHPARC